MADVATEQSSEYRVERWLYIGRRRNSKRQISHFYAQVDGDGYSSQMWGFKKKLLGYESVGALLDVHTSEDVVLTARGERGPKYVGTFDDLDEVRRLQLEDDAIMLWERAKKKAQADFEELSVRELLAPLRRYYHETPGQNRAAVLARLVYEITRPMTSAELRG